MLADRIRRAASAATTYASATTFDSSNTTNGTLSGGNLTVTATGSGGTRTVASKSTGKYYWEIPSLSGNSFPAAANSSWLTSTTAGSDANSMRWNPNGQVVTNGSGAATWATYTRGSSDVLSFAVDLGAGLIWGRVNGGNWNNSGTADPASATGGFTIPFSGALFAAATYITSGDVLTANFGATALTYSVPSGFTAGFG